jgi:hypothetical protein
VIEWYLFSPITIAEVPQIRSGHPRSSSTLSVRLNTVAADPPVQAHLGRPKQQRALVLDLLCPSSDQLAEFNLFRVGLMQFVNEIKWCLW